MVLGTLVKFAGIFIGIITFGLFVSRSSQVGIGVAGQEISDAIGSFGKGIGEIGTGIKTFGVSTGQGITGLFAPFQWLFNLGTQPASMPVLNANISASSGAGQAGARASRGVERITFHNTGLDTPLARAIADSLKMFPEAFNEAIKKKRL